MSSTQNKSVTRKSPRARWTSTLIALALGAVLGFSLVPTSREATAEADIDLHAVAEADPVAMSFVRDLNREPVPSAPVQREAIEHDELYEMINTIRWTAEEQDVPPAEITEEKSDDE